jgi:hypothetical protein
MNKLLAFVTTLAISISSAATAGSSIAARKHFSLPTPPLSGAPDPLGVFTKELADSIKNGSEKLKEDLNAADSDALAHNDTIADQCYKEQLKFLDGVPMIVAPGGSFGPIQLFQIKRDIQNALSGGIPKSLRVACAPLWMDEQAVFLRFNSVLAEAGIVLPK